MSWSPDWDQLIFLATLEIQAFVTIVERSVIGLKSASNMGVLVIRFIYSSLILLWAHLLKSAFNASFGDSDAQSMFGPILNYSHSNPFGM